jgi:phosphate/sulfate permease
VRLFPFVSPSSALPDLALLSQPFASTTSSSAQRSGGAPLLRMLEVILLLDTFPTTAFVRMRTATSTRVSLLGSPSPKRTALTRLGPSTVPVVSDDGESGSEKANTAPAATSNNHPSNLKELEKVDEHPIDGAWIEPKNLYIIFRYKAFPWVKKVLTHGTTIDIHAEQLGKEGSARHRRMTTMHSAAKQYPNEVEHMYSFVQVLTACTASFGHGSNDVSSGLPSSPNERADPFGHRSPTPSAPTPPSTTSGPPESSPPRRTPFPSGFSSSELPCSSSE